MVYVDIWTALGNLASSTHNLRVASFPFPKMILGIQGIERKCILI